MTQNYSSSHKKCLDLLSYSCVGSSLILQNTQSCYVLTPLILSLSHDSILIQTYNIETFIWQHPQYQNSTKYDTRNHFYPNNSYSYFQTQNLITKMKFVIKSGSTVKLYSGQIKIEALAQFLKENFASWNSNNLTYTDKDGDQICVTTQEDLQALQELNKDSQYLKLEVASQQQPQEEKIQKNQRKKSHKKVKAQKIPTEKKPIQFTQSVSKAQKSLSKSISKPKNCQSRKGKWRNKQGKRRCQPKESTSSDDSQRKSVYKKLEQSISNRIAEIVDSRIKIMMPCIKNQLEHNFENLSQDKSELKHQGVICNGCNISPISGIRYKCLKCQNFNLCSTCQERIEHQHDLLKMKKPESSNIQENRGIGLAKLGKKLLKEICHKPNASSQSEQEGQSKYHRRHGHGHGKGHGYKHWKGRHGFDNQDRKQHKFNKKMFKLMTVFGEKPNLKEFVEKNMDLRGRELIELYAAENNISSQQFQDKMDKMRKEKLAAFFDCPEQEFDEVLKQNPQKGFRQIIMKLKQTGKRTYTGENFKRMRQSLRREIKGEPKIETKVQGKKSCQKSSQLKDKKIEKSKGSDMKEKGNLLAEMKSLFGQDNGSVYFKFIESNFSLGQEGIIAKWIQQHSQ